MNCAALYFDRKQPDRGYAHVAASRVRTASPAGRDPDGGEQIDLSALGQSGSEDEHDAEMSYSSDEGLNASEDEDPFGDLPTTRECENV